MAGVSAPASAGRIGRDTTVDPRLAEPVASAREEAACELSAGLDRSVRFCFMGACNLQYTSGAPRRPLRSWNHLAKGMGMLRAAIQVYYIFDLGNAIQLVSSGH